MFAPYKHPDIETKPRTYTPDLDEVGQCLMDAADILRKHGWCQRALCDDVGRYCALGAISAAGTNALNLTTGVLAKHLGIVWISEWNNAPERTAEEVIAALEDAALTRAINLRNGGK